MKQSRVYTKELLEAAVKKSVNFTDLCRKLGRFPMGATYQLIKNRVIDYGIDTSHFLGRATASGYRNRSIVPMNPNNVLVSGYKYRANSKRLRSCLIRIGVEYSCAECGMSRWREKDISLHVDHINGIWSDCRRENLRFMCPNCHSQTSTHSGKNKKKRI
jgi:predicted RNA-binding Zn-ribbon protein involved in translation (DUF1610 family)